MNKFILATICASALSLLVSCSSSKDDPVAIMPPETLTIPAGLAASEETPIYAANEDDTIATLMRSASNIFAPLAATLDRTTSGEEVGTKLGEDFHIKSIAGDGSGGLDVVYIIGDEERPVNFGADDFEAEGCGDNSWCKQDEEGRNYWLWQLYEQLDYADAYGGSFPGGNRPYFTFGARTESDNLPSGSASWFGRMWVQSYQQDNPSNDARLTLDGRIVLTADFSEGTMNGLVQALRSRGDDGVYRSLEDDSSYFEISDGKMVDDQFVATLTGKGDMNVQGDGTVRGYDGNLLGEFYGPAAKELGGVVNATSDSHNRVLAGHFTGDALNREATGALSALSMATFVDRPGSSVSLTDIAGVSEVQRDGAGGFNVAYEINGVKRPVHLEATDLADWPTLRYGYHKRIGNHAYFLWDQSGSFYTDPEFDYMSFAGWAITNWADAGDDFGASTSYSGFLAHGTRTSDLPVVGNASYSGRAFAQVLPTNGSARSLLRGDLSLTADFDADTIGGRIDEIEIRSPGQSSYSATSRVWDIDNGSISGNGLTADLVEAGVASTSVSMEGHFYGPGAVEVGGVLKGSTAEGVVRGYFGGSQ